MAPRTRIVVFNPEVRAGFVAALRIQLGAAASVEVGPELVQAGTAGRVAEAQTFLSPIHEELAVWVELAAEEALLYVVGSRQQRALLEIVRIPAEDSSDLDRALALKLADIVDGAARFALGDQPPEMPESPGAEPLPPSRIQFRGEVEFRLATPSGTAPTQSAVGGGVGVTASVLPFRLEGVAGVDGAFGTRLAQSADGTVTSTEVLPWLAIRALAEWDRFSLGAGIRTHLRVVFAEGISPRGNVGESTVLVPSIALAAIGALTVVEGLSVRVRLGLEGALIRQRFLVNSQSLADLGALRFFAALGIGFRTD